MDGVLADFDAAYHKKFGKPPAPTSKEDPYISQLQGTDFFATLDKLPDADKVVALAKKYGEGKFSICSAPLRDDQKNTAHWKAVWLKKHYSGQPLENMVFTGKKDSYAVKGGQWNVLIDDKPKNINAWNARGGKGILYNGYTDSIEYLDQELSKIFSKENDITESSNMTERQEQFVEMFSKFLPIAIKVLELKSLPKFHFESFLEHPQQPTFGMYVNGENKLFVGLSSRHPNDILRTIAHELTHYKQDTEHMLDDESGRTGSPIENEANAMAGIIMRLFNKKYPEYIRSKPVMEKWSTKYKKSINCSNPKGFSQRAHCQGRKKTEDVEQDPGQPIPFPAGTTSIDVSDPYDWYKLGMVISDLDDANPKAFGKGGPSTVIAFGSEDEEHRLLPHLKRLGLKLQDIDKPSDTEKIVPAKAVLDKFEENFADGRNPQDKGDSGRHGIKKGITIAQLKKIRSSDSASPRKKQLAHWQINMRQGKAKKGK